MTFQLSEEIDINDLHGGLIIQKTSIVISEGARQEFVKFALQLGLQITIENLPRLLLGVPVLHVDGIFFLLVRVPIIE